MKLNFTYIDGIGKKKNLEINQIWEQYKQLLSSEKVTKEEAIFLYHEKIIQLFPKKAFMICTNSPLD
jgi:hypothetical protein